MKLIRLLVCVMLFAVMMTVVSAQDPQTPDELCAAAQPAERTEMQFEAAEQVLEPDVDYRAIFCTDAGAIYLDLFEDLTPITVNNIVFLAQQGYYDNITFHRVLENFMAQGGDPTGTGAGGPGYGFEDEFVSFLQFDRIGLLAMANTGQPLSNGSQFFITTGTAPHLNFRHTIFGDVLEGQDVVESLNLRDPQNTPELEASALNTVLIITDPASVETTYEAPEPATQADIATALSQITTQLPPEIPLDEEASGEFSTEDLVNSMPEAFREDFATFTENYGHQYRVTSRLVNEACNPELGFSWLRYSVDAFGSAADASSALADGFVTELATANEFTELSANHFTKSAPTCSDEEGTTGMMVYTQGHYLITVEANVFTQVLEGVGIDALLSQGVAPLFESFLTDAYFRELRAE